MQKKLLSLLIVLSLLFSLAVPAFARDQAHDIPSQVFHDAEILSLIAETRDLMSDAVWYMSEVIGPRPWGTPAEEASARYMAEIFESFGIEHVEVWDYDVAARTWPSLVLNGFDDERFGIVDRGVAVIRGGGTGNNAASVNGNRDTSASGITAQAVYAGDGSSFPAGVSGNIALVTVPTTLSGNTWSTTVNTLQIAQRAADAGARAIFFINGTEPDVNSLTFTQLSAYTNWGAAAAFQWSESQLSIPHATVPHYVGELLKAHDGTITYTAQTFDRAWNVEARIPGPSENSPAVVFTAHIDTVHGAPGANDNASGAAGLLGLAYAYAQLAERGLLQYEVIFLGCGAEEGGGMGDINNANMRAGSTQFMRRWFTAEGNFDRIAANYNMDMIGTAPIPQSTLHVGTLIGSTAVAGNNDPPTHTQVSLSALEAASRIGYMVLEPGEENAAPHSIWDDPSGWGIKLARRGASDHATFHANGVTNVGGFIWRKAIPIPGVVPPPPVGHGPQVQGPATAVGTNTHWNTNPWLENIYHTVFDTYDLAFCIEKQMFAVNVIAAASYSIIRVQDGIRMTTNAHLVEPGDYLEISTAFVEERESNAITLIYTFNGNILEYANFTTAEGATVVDTRFGEGSARITLMVPDYDAEELGRLMLRVREDSNPVRGWQTVSLNAEYVLRDEYGEKTIEATQASVRFVTFGTGDGGEPPVRGDTNGDGVVDLLDLSNMIDWFGIDRSNPNWFSFYVFFNFSNSGQINIFDISYVARLIV